MRPKFSADVDGGLSGVSRCADMGVRQMQDASQKKAFVYKINVRSENAIQVHAKPEKENEEHCQQSSFYHPIISVVIFSV